MGRNQNRQLLFRATLLRLFRAFKKRKNRIFLPSDLGNPKTSKSYIQCLVSLNLVEEIKEHYIDMKNGERRKVTGYRWKK